MKINRFKHKEKVNYKKLNIINALAFLMGFSGALLAYVISSYLKEILGTDNVGFIYFIAYFIVLILLLNLHRIVRVFGKSFTLQLSIILKIISITGILFSGFSFWGIFFLIIYTIAGTLSWTAMDTIVESFSKDIESGRIRGIHLTIANAGFLMGPLLSSQVLERYDFYGVFLMSLITYSVILIISIISLRRTNHKFREKIGAIKLLKKVLERKNIMRIYYVSFVLELFYALMLIYAPLYLLSKGFSWDQLGIAFTIMLVPFVLIQYPMGILADKKTGEKEFLLLSFLILGISTLIFYFSDSADIMVWATILLLGRIGAALVEILRESYFYKRVDGDNVDIINFFKTARPVAYIIATFFSSILLYFFDLKSIFLFITVACFSAIYPTFRLMDNKSEKEILKMN
ncbi:MAG: MFS transporter [Candidatus Moranbacteria bacterium]|jgi:MFS family permease|nr:MFS transporter [Candidatus Moranbacteria bacterium]MDD5652080.1 MFS transporter [Candidatus Moranbacteria bacterium]MDX9855673.1 MFS transporter [Candidatus Moranbacteria bacterium]